MASDPPSAYSEAREQPLTDDPAPVYNELIATVDTDTRIVQHLEQIQFAAQQQQPHESQTPAYKSSYLDGKAEPPHYFNIAIHVGNYGHRVRLAIHGTLIVEENGLEFFDIGGDSAQPMAFMVKSPGFIPGMEQLKAGDVGKRRKDIAEILQSCWKPCASVDEVKEDEIRSPKETENSAAYNVYHAMATNLAFSYRSSALIPKPKDWGPHISISSFYFLSFASNYQPDSELANFLASGPAPVYIGFGSIVVDDPNAMTQLIFDAVRKKGQRALVSKG
ncbi:uncharacterized protein BP5553_08870 [Venustampulla echinocandica]|uniref:Uncharacterized protein n=1 Tax=Venustampulla echinocandica TaxID=2656787 RepID=A0A370TDA9_9HELO|nr:uncharacterized protein BP5553_08870 [Venustampulla echinocandica]RDL32414.1 hypothetical protein BP5553_08870 [Venustampulla echinocandica]